jgi:methionyl-tRNA formyltransferase
METVLAVLGARLLLPVVDDLAAGRAVETPQDHSRATHAAKITKDEGALDWNQPASLVHNRVRGLQPWPLAWTRLGSDRLVLRRTRPLGVSANRTTGDPDLRHGGSPDLIEPGPPGTILRAAGAELIVACGDGTAVQVLELQPEGRRTMTAREFLAGRTVTAGARFTP